MLQLQLQHSGKLAIGFSASPPQQNKASLAGAPSMRAVLRCRMLGLLGCRPNGRCCALSSLSQPSGTRSINKGRGMASYGKGRPEEVSESSGTTSSDGIKAPQATESSGSTSSASFGQEKAKDEFASLLDQFGLSDVPSSDPGDHGVTIDDNYQLSIVDEAASRKKHKTALVLSAAPKVLSKRDISRIETPAKHLAGWRVGGLEEVIPIRYHKGMERRPGWIFIFGTPFHAYEYQMRAHRIRKAAREHMPFFPTSGIQPPQHHQVDEDKDFAIQDYTLTSPWQHPALSAELHPFSDSVQRYVDLHHKIISSDNKDDEVFPVRVWVSQEHNIVLDSDILKRLIAWDAKVRGASWHIANSEDAYTRMRARLPHSVLDDDGTKPPAWGSKPNDNWRILFTNASNARRFQRVWHRARLPDILTVRESDPMPPLMKVECLFHDDNF